MFKLKKNLTKKTAQLIILAATIFGVSNFAFSAVTGTNSNDLIFFQGSLGQLTTTITNPYSGKSISINEQKNINVETYDGLDGFDILFMSNIGDALFIEDSLGGQTIFDIEFIRAGQGGDIVDLAHLSFILGDMAIDGGGGADIIWANSGNDSIDGRADNDVIDGGPGDDRIMGGDGDDSLYGGQGNDTISGGSGDDYIEGSEGNDLIAGNIGNNILLGGAGDDTYNSSINGDINTILGDTIIETSGFDRILCPLSVNSIESFSFVRLGNDLKITHADSLGMGNIITIQNQFASIDSRVELINYGGGSIDLTNVVIADAGSDQTVDEGALISLNGAQSIHSLGKNLNYDWSQVGGPNITLSNANSPSPTFQAPFVPENQTLTFELIVDDGVFYSEPATVNIVVVSVNNPPVADAGDNGTVKPGALAALNGSNSFDPESDEISFQWSQVSGTLVSLSDATSANPTFTGPNVVGDVLVFKLQVSDGKESSTLSPGLDTSLSDTVSISIVENSPPVANAGQDQSIDEGNSVVLNGTASFDPDGGDTLSYNWTQTEGTSVNLIGATSPTPNFTSPNVGPGGEDLTFQLVVSDDDPVNPLESLSDEVIIHVLNSNDPPNCSLAVASISSLWPPNHKLSQININGVMDPNPTDNISLTITGITQDEPVNGLGDGDTSPDAVIQINEPNDSVLLRAERAGNGNGRVYEISFTASDGEDSCNGSVKVGVPKSRKSAIVDDGQVENSELQ